MLAELPAPRSCTRLLQHGELSLSDTGLQGKSKKDAKQTAAASALEMLLENVPEADFQLPGRGALQLKVGAVCGGLVQQRPVAQGC